MVFVINVSSFANTTQQINGKNIELVSQNLDTKEFVYAIDGQNVKYQYLDTKENEVSILVDDGNQTQIVTKDEITGKIFVDGELYAIAKTIDEKISKTISIGDEPVITRGSGTSWSVNPFFGDTTDYGTDIQIHSGSIEWMVDLKSVGQSVIIAIALSATPLGIVGGIFVGTFITYLQDNTPDYTYYQEIKFRHDDAPGYYEHNTMYYNHSNLTDPYANHYDVVYSTIW
jgi:hypothetical protein